MWIVWCNKVEENFFSNHLSTQYTHMCIIYIIYCWAVQGGRRAVVPMEILQTHTLNISSQISSFHRNAESLHHTPSLSALQVLYIPMR